MKRHLLFPKHVLFTKPGYFYILMLITELKPKARLEIL